MLEQTLRLVIGIFNLTGLINDHFVVIVISDVVLESGSVLESDSSTYFEDLDSNPLDSDLDSSPLDSDSDSNPKTRLDSRCSGIGLSIV